MEKELCPLPRVEAAEVKLKDHRFWGHQLWVKLAQGRPLLRAHECFGLMGSDRSVGLLKTSLCCIWK